MLWLSKHNNVKIFYRLDNPITIELISFRTVIFVLSTFDSNLVGFFLIKYFLTIGVSIFLSYQYMKYLPFYNETVSIIFGFLCYLLTWLVANSVLVFLIPLSGHFIVLIVGIIPIYLLVKSMRSRIIDELLMKQADQTITELESITQCFAVYSLIKTKNDPEEEIKLIGLVNLYLKDGKRTKASLLDTLEFYDPCIDKHVKEGDSMNLHRNPVFLKHFAKSYFEVGIVNFGNYPGIRIAYASFLFHAFKNIHGTLSELAYAKKSKPNIMQSFEIFKFE